VRGGFQVKLESQARGVVLGPISTDPRTGKAVFSGVDQETWFVWVTPAPKDLLTRTPAQFGVGLMPNPVAGLRELSIVMKIDAGAIDASSLLVQQERAAHAYKQSDTELLVDHLPDFIRSTHRHVRGMGRGRPPIDRIVIHHTLTTNVQDTNFFGNTGHLSAHYVVDKDGHVIKVVEDDDAAEHGGDCVWRDQESMNERSIGIEIVNRVGEPYPSVQMDAVVDLVEKLMAGVKASGRGEVSRHDVVGHADVAEEASTTRTLGGKGDCPGPLFDWRKLAAHNPRLATRLDVVIDDSILNAAYGGYFAPIVPIYLVPSFRPPLALRDQDAQKFSPPTYGGIRLAGWSGGDVIAAIQTDLRALGYSVASKSGTISGIYDHALRQAIRVWKQHYFSLGVTPGVSGLDGEHFDRENARMLLAALADANPTRKFP
jgi:N-acetyl-anhydromuramyl-L-alanine amidase AmpD